jgi:hypothetical protein
MLKSQFNPETIFTSGIISARQLKNLPVFKSTNIQVLGSTRSMENARFISRKDVEWCCIVLPEGIMSECITLLSFALKCALRLPSVNFILRLHPLITFSKLGDEWPELLKLPRNIVFSVAPLEHDMSRANIALYRGSTTIVKAVRFSLMPIYLELPGEMSIDPLFEISEGVMRVGDIDDFSNIVSHKDPSKVLPTSDSEIAGYCKNFYTPFDISIISSQII